MTGLKNMILIRAKNGLWRFVFYSGGGFCTKMGVAFVFKAKGVSVLKVNNFFRSEKDRFYLIFSNQIFFVIKPHTKKV